MATYVLEAYVPRSHRLSDLHAATREAADALVRRGRPVRLIRSIYLSGDETCFLLVDAHDRTAAEELCSDLQLAVVRIAEAVTLPRR